MVVVHCIKSLSGLGKSVSGARGHELIETGAEFFLVIEYTFLQLDSTVCVSDLFDVADSVLRLEPLLCLIHMIVFI